jgi:hypothetical protein
MNPRLAQLQNSRFGLKRENALTLTVENEVRVEKPTFLQLAAVCGWINLIGASLLLLAAFKGGPLFGLAALLGYASAGLIFCGCAAITRRGM